MQRPNSVRRLFAVAAAALAAQFAQVRSADAQQVTVDNVDAGFSVLSGTWNTGSFPVPWGADYRFADTAGGGTALVEWRPNLPATGLYRVEIWFVEGANRANNAPFTVHHANGSTPLLVSQRVNGQQWLWIGDYQFNAGTGGRVTLGNNANPSVVIADAVRFTLQGEGVEPEFRGMWISRFEWPSTNLATVQNNITNIMTNLATHNFNAAVFQVRGQCDTLYPSPLEPWSPILSNNGNAPAGWGSFDPMEFAITNAHSRGLEFHAYINTHTVWQSSTCAKPTYDLDHVFWDHFNADNPAARDWLVHDDFGNPVQCEESSYVWIAPGVPGAQAYVRQQVMYVVENYDVDGVHYDRIRTPGTEYSNDPISLARLFGEGNPDGLGFADWTRDQITRFTSDLYAQIMEVKPHVKVSSAPLGLYASTSYPGYPAGPCGFFYGYSCVYQDAQAWLAAGAQDFIVPQIYWADGGNLPDFSDILPDWIANNAGRHIYAGQINSVGIGNLLSQLGVTRTMGGEGNVVFSYSSFNNANNWPSYSGVGGPYEFPVPVPDMPWKDTPTLGIIIGNVTHAVTTNPIVDAHVQRNGSSYTALTSGDGLYSFLLVPPGSYTMTFEKLGVGSRLVTGIDVVAGQVTRVDTTLGLPTPPGDFDGDDLVEISDDWPLLSDCMMGPNVTYPLSDPCLIADADGDLDVDLDDVWAIQPTFVP